MFSLYFVVLFFIYIFNLLLPSIISKKRLENIIFKKAEENGMTKIMCKYNAWFIISKNLRYIDIEYITREGKILDCKKYKPEKTDNYHSCGKEGLFNNKKHLCYNIISELLYNI